MGIDRSEASILRLPTYESGRRPDIVDCARDAREGVRKRFCAVRRDQDALWSGDGWLEDVGRDGAGEPCGVDVDSRARFRWYDDGAPETSELRWDPAQT